VLPACLFVARGWLPKHWMVIVLGSWSSCWVVGRRVECWSLDFVCVLCWLLVGVVGSSIVDHRFVSLFGGWFVGVRLSFDIMSLMVRPCRWLVVDCLLLLVGCRHCKELIG